MVKKKYVCKRCGKAFVVDVFEKGEAEEKKLRAYPVTCPYCGGRQLQPA